jgi:hypothetical protein
MQVLRRYAWVVFLFFAVLLTLFGIFPGSWFEEGVDRDFVLLATTFGQCCGGLDGRNSGHRVPPG